MWYSYAVVRLVPRPERGECFNVGVILHAPTEQFLDARIEVDEELLGRLAPAVDRPLIQRHLDAYLAICRGERAGGPLAELPLSERFHWLTAPRSTVIQVSPVHIGNCEQPAETLQTLMDTLVRRPSQATDSVDTEGRVVVATSPER